MILVIMKSGKILFASFGSNLLVGRSGMMPHLFLIRSIFKSYFLNFGNGMIGPNGLLFIAKEY